MVQFWFYFKISDQRDHIYADMNHHYFLGSLMLLTMPVTTNWYEQRLSLKTLSLLSMLHLSDNGKLFYIDFYSIPTK